MVQFLHGFAIVQLLVVFSAVFYAVARLDINRAQLTYKLEREMDTFHLHPSIFKRGCSVGPVEITALQHMPLVQAIKSNGIRGSKMVYYNQNNLAVSGCKINHLSFNVAKGAPTFEDRWLAHKKPLESQLLMEADAVRENMLAIQLEQLHKRFWRTYTMLAVILKVAFGRSILDTLFESMCEALNTLLDIGNYLLDIIEDLPAGDVALIAIGYLLIALYAIWNGLVRVYGFVIYIVPTIFNYIADFCYMFYLYVRIDISKVAPGRRMPGSLRHDHRPIGSPHNDNPPADNGGNNDSDDDNNNSNNETGTSRIRCSGHSNNGKALQQQPTEGVPHVSIRRDESIAGPSTSSIPSPPPSPSTKDNHYYGASGSCTINLRHLYGTRDNPTAITSQVTTTSDPAPVTTTSDTNALENQPTNTSLTLATPVSQVNPPAQSTSTGAPVVPQVSAVSDTPAMASSSQQVAQGLKLKSRKGKEPAEARPQSSNQPASAFSGRPIKPLPPRRATSTTSGFTQQPRYPVASVAPFPIAAASSSSSSSQDYDFPNTRPDYSKRKKRTKPASKPASTKSTSSSSSCARSARSTTSIAALIVQEPSVKTDAPPTSSVPTTPEFTFCIRVETSSVINFYQPIVPEMAGSVSVAPIQAPNTAHAQSSHDDTSALGAQYGQPQPQQTLVAGGYSTQSDEQAAQIFYQQQQQQYLMAQQQQQQQEYMMVQQQAHEQAHEQAQQQAQQQAHAASHQHLQPNATAQHLYQDDGLGEDLAAVLNDMFGAATDPGVRVIHVPEASHEQHSLPPQQQQQHQAQQHQISHEQLADRRLTPDEFRLWQQHQECTQQEELNQWQHLQRELQHRELTEWQHQQHQCQYQELDQWQLADAQRIHEQLHQWQLQQYQRQHQALSQWQTHQQQRQQEMLFLWQQEQQARQEQLYQQALTEQQLNQGELYHWQLYDQQRPHEELRQWHHFRKQQCEQEKHVYQQQLRQLNHYLQWLSQQQHVDEDALPQYLILQQQATQDAEQSMTHQQQAALNAQQQSVISQQYLAQDAQYQSVALQQVITKDASMGNELQQYNNQAIGHATWDLDMHSTRVTLTHEIGNRRMAPPRRTWTSAVHFYCPSIHVARFTNHRYYLSYRNLLSYRRDPRYNCRRRIWRRIPLHYLPLSPSKVKIGKTSRKLTRYARCTQKRQGGGDSGDSDMIMEGPSDDEEESTIQSQVFTYFQIPAQNQAPAGAQVPTYSGPPPIHFQAPAHVADESSQLEEVPMVAQSPPYDEAMAYLDTPVQLQGSTSTEALTYALPTAHFQAPTRTEVPTAAPTVAPTFSTPPTGLQTAAYYQELANFWLPARASEPSRFRFPPTSLTDAPTETDPFTQAAETNPSLARTSTEARFHFHHPTRSDGLAFNSAISIPAEAPPAITVLKSQPIPDQASVIPGANNALNDAMEEATLQMQFMTTGGGRLPTPPRPVQEEQEPIAESSQPPTITLKLFDTDSDDEEQEAVPAPAAHSTQSSDSSVDLGPRVLSLPQTWIPHNPDPEPTLEQLLANLNVDVDPAMIQAATAYNFADDPSLPNTSNTGFPTHSEEEHPSGDPREGHGSDFSENSRVGGSPNEASGSAMADQSQSDDNDSNRPSSLPLTTGEFTAPSQPPSHLLGDQRQDPPSEREDPNENEDDDMDGLVAQAGQISVYDETVGTPSFYASPSRPRSPSVSPSGRPYEPVPLTASVETQALPGFLTTGLISSPLRVPPVMAAEVAIESSQHPAPAAPITNQYDFRLQDVYSLYNKKKRRLGADIDKTKDIEQEKEKEARQKAQMVTEGSAQESNPVQDDESKDDDDNRSEKENDRGGKKQKM